MTFKFALKAGLAAMAVAAASAASAAPFFLDIGTNYGPPGDQACATCTSVKDEFLITYQSATTIFDTDANGLDAGDGVNTNAGLVVGPLATNRITGFNPGQVFGSNSDNGYGTNWLIGFSIANLGGIVTGVTAGVPSISYGPGLLQLYVTFNGTTFNNFMDIEVTGGAATGLGTVLFGKVDFTNVDAGYNNLWHSAGYSCNGSTSFFDIWTNCGGATDALSIDFASSFDTNVLASSVVDNNNGTFSIRSNHDGSGTFAIPEPGSLALMGVALAGLGFAQRRRKQAK